MKSLLLPIIAAGAVAALAMGKKSGSTSKRNAQDAFLHAVEANTMACIESGAIDPSGAVPQRMAETFRCTLAFMEGYDLSMFSAEERDALIKGAGQSAVEIVGLIATAGKIEGAVNKTNWQRVQSAFKKAVGSLNPFDTSRYSKKMQEDCAKYPDSIYCRHL